MTIYKNNAGHSYRIISEGTTVRKTRAYPTVDVQFLATGYIKLGVYKSNHLAGKVRDVYEPTYTGIGYSGEHSKPPHWKQAKRLWTNMLKRCYDKNYKAGYYGRGITVCTRWQSFANFLTDIEKLEGFEDWLLGFTKGNLKYNLDKDLKYPKNKVYCKEACTFVPESINKSAGAKNGKPFKPLKRDG